MLRHNFKIIFRKILKDKAYSIINIGGLAMGMVVAMLIGLWVFDELSFNKYHKNYDNIVQVLRNEKRGDINSTSTSLGTGTGSFMSQGFSDQVEEVFMVADWQRKHVIGYEQNKFKEDGLFIQENGPRLLGLEMVSGTLDGLKELRAIMLSETLAKKLFGNSDPIGETLKIDGNPALIVSGVYKDIPNNSRFTGTDYFARMVLIVGQNGMNTWDNFNVNIYAKLAPGSDTDKLSNLFTNACVPHFRNSLGEREINLYLHPMEDWHLRSEFKDGVQVTSQEMKFVWLYGTIGAFVLILACINFTNLSTARSEKRAKESGIRKTLGSIRKELIAQFYIESLLYSLFAFVFSLILLVLLLPWFNETSGKTIETPWIMGGFWLISLSFVVFTAILAGSYPAVYLSSFNPVKALKGTFSAGKRASIPRKVLVVIQFTISIALISGTITVNNQIEVAKDRPVGYSPRGLVAIEPSSGSFSDNIDVLKTEMTRTGMVKAIGTSNYPIINNLGSNRGVNWEGMEEGFNEPFNTINISHEYAEAVGMEFIDGRDFSREFETDRNTIIINRSAMEIMGLENPVGEVINYDPGWRPAQNYTIIGVVEDMVKQSPFDKTEQALMFLDDEDANYIYIRLNPDMSASKAIAGLRDVFESILPEDPFDFSFADDDYNKKFVAEERISTQASFFSILAVLISCLGLFGLASYMAEQRVMEIGVRKVLGASVPSILMLLSKDFAILLMIACFISIPIAYNVLSSWLDTYEIRTQLHWWIFAISGIGALSVALITVSYQALKAAIANPVKSLRSE